MGRLQQQQKGNSSEAIRYYLAAVSAGGSLEDVAPYLASAYRVDIETILPSQSGTQAKKAEGNLSNHEISAIPISASARRTTKRETDETVITLPKPQAVLKPVAQ